MERLNTLFPQVLSKETSVKGRALEHTPLKRDRLWPECMRQRSQHGKELRHKTYEKFQAMFMSFQCSKVKLTTSLSSRRDFINTSRTGTKELMTVITLQGGMRKRNGLLTQEILCLSCSEKREINGKMVLL